MNSCWLQAVSMRSCTTVDKAGSRGFEMLYTIPDYYKEFACVAGECPDTCCAGWQIVIDDKTKQRYKKYPGNFGRRLRTSIDWKESVFKQNNRRCAFLNGEGLCDLYLEGGESLFCKTCRRYPRHVEEYEDLREISLSLSCPEVAGMLMKRKEKVKFVTVEKEMPAEEYEEFDYMLFTKLSDARDVMFSILQNRTYDIFSRMAMVLALGHDLQRRVSNEQLFDVDELLERYSGDGALKRFLEKKEEFRVSYREKRKLLYQMSEMFSEMEVLNPDFPKYVSDRIKDISDAPELAGDFGLDRVTVSQEEQIWLEQLAVYFIYTYFCGAVYDEQPYAKVKFAMLSVLMIRQLYKGDERSRDGFCESAAIEAAYRYSKEVEHSDNNLIRLEEIVRQRKIYSLQNFLRLFW
nr:flagellin lysine-N-methylase [Lachnospiraceae bacterium]